MNVRPFLASIRTLTLGLLAFRKRSLFQVARRVHRNHYQHNTAALEFKYRPTRRCLAWIDKNAARAGIAILFLYIALGITSALIEPPAWAPPPPTVVDYFRDLQAINFALLGAQATLLGLVYPLVIALVGLMFEARSSTGGRLSIYFKETEALTVGRSSLALIIAIGFQSLLYGTLSGNTVVALTVLNVTWFTFNLGALGFFVVRSLEFVRPARRQSLIKSYVTNTAWRAQLFDLIVEKQWFGSSVYGHLPNREDENSPVIMPFDFDPPILSISLSEPSTIKDIYFGPLAVVLGCEGCRDRISFSPRPGRTYVEEVVLARGRQVNLSWAEKFLIRAAFRIGRPSRREAPPPTERILSEATGELMDLFESRRYEEFDARIDDLVELHGLLYALAQEVPEEGEGSFNYAALQNEWSSSISVEWVRAYRDLVRRIGDHLIDDWRFFETGAYLASRLQRRAEKVAHYNATAALFHLPATLFRALIEGAIRRRAEADDAPTRQGSLFNPQGPDSGFYRKAWLSFVGGWESFADALVALPNRDEPTWTDLCGVTQGLKRHLRDTALMLAQAAKSGERQAIRWTSDLLLKWNGRTSRQWNARHGYALKRSLITLALTEREWSEVRALPIGAFPERFEPADVFDAAVENLWRDTLVILLSSLIDLLCHTGASDGFENGPGEAAAFIFQNRSFDPGASEHPDQPPLTTGSILQSVLRLIGGGGRFEGGYPAELSGLAGAINDLEGPNFVSARVYSFIGEANVNDQGVSQILMLAASISDPDRRRLDFDLSGQTRELLLPEEDRLQRRVLQHLHVLRQIVSQADPRRGCAVVAALLGRECTEAEFGKRLRSVDRLLEACQIEIQGHRNMRIIAAPIDPRRLKEIAEAATATAFSAERGPFPVSRFSTIEFVDTPLERFTVTQQEEKGSLSSPLMGDIVSNEREYWDGVIHDRLGAVIMCDVIKAARARVNRYPRSVDGYWRALKLALSDVEQRGQKPVIVRPARGQPAWLDEWLFDRNRDNPRPPDALIDRRDDREDEYGFHLIGAPLFSSPWIGPATWVFGQEMLETINFQRFRNGTLVDVVFEADPADVWKGQLAVAFARQVKIGEGPFWRIKHPRSAPD